MIRYSVISIVLFLSVLLFFPNFCNHRETLEFSGMNRQLNNNVIEISNDSATVRISEFYNRGKIVRFLLGDHHRQLWSTPVTLPVFRWKSDSLNFTIERTGGGQQTTSFKLTDQFGRSFTLRSVNKDQANAMPSWLRKTGIRTLFRDQASALDPFAAPVVRTLSEYAGIFSTRPVMVYIPDTSNIPEEFQTLLTGRVMLLEIEPDKTWQNEKLLGYPERIIKTDRLMEEYVQGIISVDSLDFAYHRLFDVLIGDWDRHGKQWMWRVDSNRVAHPLPVDRDMAFYRFNDGLINKLALKVNPKFQTYQGSIDNVMGYMVNGRELDSIFLKNISRDQWIAVASKLSKMMQEQNIDEAFSVNHIPDSIISTGEKSEILKSRISELERVSLEFFNQYHK